MQDASSTNWSTCEKFFTYEHMPNEKKTMLYPLFWYENTSNLRGEYTGDLKPNTPNRASR